MKIRINKETYYNNPCPKITKEIWNWFYYNLWYSFSMNNHNEVKKIATIDIRINQAYKGCSNIHFYVTINKGLVETFDFHMGYQGMLDNEAFESLYKQRYKWMVDFIHGDIDLGTTKPIERHERDVELRRLKKKSKNLTSRLVNDYKQYLRLKEIFEPSL